MDFRMVKTRSQIKKAFLTLREKLMPERIKVKDICEVANINKTTFYHHYTDSMQLSDEIDNSAIETVISDFSERDKIYEDPKAYIKGFFGALSRETDNLKLVFRGKQAVLCAKLEERLHNLYSDKVENIEDGVRLSFAIGGFVRVVEEYIFKRAKENIEHLAEYTLRMIESLLGNKRELKNST